MGQRMAAFRDNTRPYHSKHTLSGAATYSNGKRGQGGGFFAKSYQPSIVKPGTAYARFFVHGGRADGYNERYSGAEATRPWQATAPKKKHGSLVFICSVSWSGALRFLLFTPCLGWLFCDFCCFHGEKWHYNATPALCVRGDTHQAATVLLDGAVLLSERAIRVIVRDAQPQYHLHLLRPAPA